jgi:hypothetical protein
VNDARAALGGVGSLDAAVPQLEDAAAGLEDLEGGP